MSRVLTMGLWLIAALVCSLSWSSVNTNAAPVSASTLHPDWRGVSLDSSEARGLKWLISVQGADGGWGQDGGNSGQPGLEGSSNDVANTSMVALALLRSGATPGRGAYGDALNRALRFVLTHVEESPTEGLAITRKTGTQIQHKLGPFIDTFLATMLLSEIDGQAADEASQKRVRAALKKCVAKIEHNQQSDGSWNISGGWAPIIGTSLASRGLDRAQSKGVLVDKDVLKRVDGYTRSNFDSKGGKFKADAAGAGVELYQAAQALEQASRSADSRKENAPMNRAATSKLAEADFVKGFGSMGGEEFVSYLNISDSLLRIGGEDWTKWNGKIKQHLVNLQNQDGTWAGHHCITGRVTCTSAALMTLTAERTASRTERTASRTR
jgi:hypothetical protein